MALQTLIFSASQPFNNNHYNHSSASLLHQQYLSLPITSLASFLKPISLFSLYSNGSRSFFPHATLSEQTAKVDNKEEEITNIVKLKQKVEALGINCNTCTPGEYNYLICPKCNGGLSLERSLSFHIIQSGEFAMWRCFDVECGWAGQIFVDDRTVTSRVSQMGRLTSSSRMSEENLRLEPLGDELIAYFAERKISKATLQKNCVMQIAGNQDIIAFTYKKNGMLVGCKYRSVHKRYWQEKGTEKILYGVDDIKAADEIIIVEGEIDKLSMDEVGFVNCVSVPDGAPQAVSDKDLPSLEKDTRFQYLWNGKEYLDKATRIILATDGDIPGQALAEELARRLGRERCWQVRWPKKDEFTCFKDANEILKSLGSDALRDIVNNAEFYQMQNLN